MLIEGTVAPGYESVRHLYQQNMHQLAERNTQLCVYVGDTCVVDLWASAIDDTSFTADSLVNVFSSGKTLEAILLAMLVDRGLLDYNAPIAQYWPEYGNRDKQQTTVADLMRHEAGLAGFDTTLDPLDLHPDRLASNAIGAVIERQQARFRAGEGNQREYHAITRGWVANELFRRIEPAGRTMGQFLQQEVSGPLGADAYIGLPNQHMPRLSKVAMLGFGYQMLQGLVPQGLGRKMELNLAQMIAKLWRLRGVIKNRSTAGLPAPVANMKGVAAFDSEAMSKGETPSAGAKCSARGLAKLAAVMANGGSFGGIQLMSPTAYSALHAEPIERNMMALNTTFTQGGLATFPVPRSVDTPMDAGLNRGREGFFGWMGLGGSIFQWHPDHKIGFAYVPTSLNVLDIVNERGKAYQAAVVDCLAGV